MQTTKETADSDNFDLLVSHDEMTFVWCNKIEDFPYSHIGDVPSIFTLNKLSY